MGFLEDLTPVFRKHPLQFVRSVKENGDAVSFFFRCGDSPPWKAGQHGVFSFPQKMKGGAWRGFSIASSPDEDLIRIATRIRKEPSDFKKALMGLQPGDEIFMRGPFGPFHLGGFRGPVVFIAGGIGITPYRALILDAVRNKRRAPASIRLIHADDAAHYVFRQEIEEAASSVNELRALYLNSRDLPVVIAECVGDVGDQAVFFLSGPMRMVWSIRKSLRQQGIPGKRIRNELFLGL